MTTLNSYFKRTKPQKTKKYSNTMAQLKKLLDDDLRASHVQYIQGQCPCPVCDSKVDYKWSKIDGIIEIICQKGCINERY